MWGRISGLLAVVCVACSSGTSKTAAPMDSATADDVAVEDTAGSVCNDLRAALQAAVDGARTSPNAVVAVSTEECSSIVVASGDATTGGVDSLWRLASVTKTYVSATVLGLVKDGKLTLDDPLSKWVPDVPNTTGVTVRMLLNHTSGVFNFNDDPAFTRTVAWTPQQLVEMGTKHAQYFAAGTSFRYSNTDYVLLGLVAEAAGGAKLGVLLHKYAIDRAGLKGTFFSGEDTLNGTSARGFSAGMDITEKMLSYATWAAGSMVARADDAAQWMRRLYATNDILDATQQALLFDKPVTVSSGYEYGLGVQIYKSFYKSERAVGHFGDTTGFHTWALWFPNRKLAFAAVVNEESDRVDDVGHAALDVLLK